MRRQTRPEPIAASHGIAFDRHLGAVAPPICLSSTFAFARYERSGAHEHSRVSNSSRALLAQALARLEGGAGAVMTASGMAAIDLVLSLLRPSDLVLAPTTATGAPAGFLPRGRSEAASTWPLSIRATPLHSRRGSGTARSSCLSRHQAIR